MRAPYAEHRPAGNEATSENFKKARDQHTPHLIDVLDLLVELDRPWRPETARDWRMWNAGRSEGFAAGIDYARREPDYALVEERARELVRRDARAFGRWAYEEALRRHGRAWAELVAGEAS